MKKWSSITLCYNEEMWIPYQLKQLNDSIIDEIMIVDGSHGAHKDIDDKMNKKVKYNEPHRFGIINDNLPSFDDTREIIKNFNSNKIKFLGVEDIHYSIVDEQSIKNFCVDSVSFKYIFMADTDEFYMDLNKYLMDFEKIFENGYDLITVKTLYEFYFDFDKYIISTNIPVAIKKGIKFVATRLFDTNKEYIYDGICYHYSYIKPYERIRQKMNGYGWKGQRWFNNIVNNYGKVPDNELSNYNSVNPNSIHFCIKNKIFEKNKIEHPRVVKPLIEKWKWNER